MRSLTNRLRLSWLTVAALAAFVVVALVGPDDVSVARLLFAGNADRFTQLLLQRNELTPRFETVTLLRAQLAADMMFSRRLRPPAARVDPRPHRDAFFPPAPHGPIVVMIADALENVSALTVLRELARARRRRTGGSWS